MVFVCFAGFSLLRNQKKWQEGLVIAANTSLVQQVRKTLKFCRGYNFIFIPFRVDAVLNQHGGIYLGPNYALLTRAGVISRKYFFITKKEFSIRPKKDRLVLTGIKIEIEIDQKRLVGYMSKKDMDRFNNWKNQSAEPPSGK